MSHADQFHQGLAAIFQALLESDRKELVTHHSPVLEALRAHLPLTQKEDLASLFSDVDTALEDLVLAAHPDVLAANAHHLTFLYLHYDFLEPLVRHLIETREGPACCADKSQWLLNAYDTYLIDGTLPDMTIGEKMFWKPHFGDAAQWMLFIESLEHLYYGNPTRYFVTMHTLVQEDPT